MSLKDMVTATVRKWASPVETVWVIWVVRMVRNLDGTTVGYSEPAQHEDGCYILFKNKEEAESYRDDHCKSGGVGEIRTQDLAISRIRTDDQQRLIISK